MRKEIITLTLSLIIVLFANSAYCLNTDSMKIAILSGNYRQAVAEGEKLIAGKSSAVGFDEAYYLLGLSLLKEGSYRRAADNFEIIIKEYKNSHFLDEARLGLGDTYLLKGELNSAASAYKELIDGNPGTKLKAQAFQRLSQVSFNSGESENGKLYLDKLDKEFPLNIEPKIARQIQSAKISLSSGGEIYSVQVGSFSNKSNADGLVDKLTQSGYIAYTEVVTPEGLVSYRVRVGKSNLRREVEDLEQRLSREGYPTKICP